MARYAKNMLQLIGNTPLLKGDNYSQSHNLKASLYLKLEYFNPGGSIKDRVALNMLEEAEKTGLITDGTVIIEPTSGNTGVGLAMACAAKKYRLILTMPETMSMERRKLLAALGAELVLTPGASGMQGSIDKANQIKSSLPKAFIPQQFENPANPDAHKKSTAMEIWNDLDGKVDILVAGVGTGGTITGTGEKLKELNPDLKIIAIEPKDSPLLSGGKAGPHGLQGIGANFIPKIVRLELFDEIFPVSTENAYASARELAKTEGLLVGITSGAAAYAGTVIAQRPENYGKSIVVILPDGGERYLSTKLFSDD